jgi:hypothetical protein
MGWTASAEAQQVNWYQGWRVIGFKVVNGGSDTDWINTPGARRYRQIRICAFNAPLGMRDVDVYFANGGHQDLNTRDILRPGTCTRALDLNGRARDITRVRLKYGRLARGLHQAPLVRVTAR